LIVRGGFEDLCTDPENGKVSFVTNEEIEAWIERLALAAPGRPARLVRQEGDALLETTERVRSQANRVSPNSSSHRSRMVTATLSPDI